MEPWYNGGRLYMSSETFNQIETSKSQESKCESHAMGGWNGTKRLMALHQVTSTARRKAVPMNGPWDQRERWGMHRR